MRQFRPELQTQLLEAVDNQLRENNPPQARQHYERLRAQGVGDDEARRMIANVFVAELTEIFCEQRPFNRARYAERLAQLPDMPWEGQLRDEDEEQVEKIIEQAERQRKEPGQK